MASQSQPQQINITDLELPQLAEVKKQLEEVRSLFLGPVTLLTANDCIGEGTEPPHQLLHTVETSSGEIQLVYRKCERSQSREQE